MYIVKETLEKLAGNTLKSKENKGTKFIIQFPNQNKTRLSMNIKMKIFYLLMIMKWIITFRNILLSKQYS
jgi:chemotaxis protein histidine kinase CheA